MKINSKELNDMTCKQIQDIYLKAYFGEIEEEELIRIREALYELTPLCKFTRDEYSSLIVTLDELSDEALNNIVGGFFSAYYRRGLKSVTEIPKDFDHCDGLVTAIYTDYRRISSLPHYMLMNDYMLDLYRYTDFDNKDVVRFLSLMNPELCSLLAETRRLESEQVYSKLKGMDVSTLHAYAGILQQLLTTYMIYIDEYKDAYSLPATILVSIVNSCSEEQIQKFGMSLRLASGDRYYVKELLDYYYKAMKKPDEGLGKR